jgi:hypothetical protein
MQQLRLFDDSDENSMIVLKTVPDHKFLLHPLLALGTRRQLVRGETVLKCFFCRNLSDF